MIRIVGSVLVRNEDIFVERAMLNIIDFCDEILVQDHQSTDGTREILERLAARFPKIKLQRIDDPRESSQAIAHLADTPAWIFGVDGDEIYDPAGLARMRAELLAGKYDDWWAIFGNVLHCTHVEVTAGRATGYLTPPSKSMTKLYNFRLLRSVDPQALLRLAGRNDVFHDPAMRERRLNLHVQHPWEEAWFRCLHTCFVPRSTLDRSAADTRENVSERFNWMRQWKNRARRLLGLGPERPYKMEKYRRGAPVSLEVGEFFGAAVRDRQL
jgi:glycosyltransferase involved in cell wall biosynthesis